eukprot:6965161-Pyramimonas_sp.AAC.1
MGSRDLILATGAEGFWIKPTARITGTTEKCWRADCVHYTAWELRSTEDTDLNVSSLCQIWPVRAR